MKDTLKRRSYETSNDIIRLHLNPEFGSMNLTDLDRKGIQSMYARKRESLSAARVKRIHSVLAASLSVAVRWGYIEKNPCDAVSKPKVPQPEIRPSSKEEAKRFIAAASGERYEALFVLGLTSGARWGELAGLQWGDLNLDNKVMHIQRALVNGYGGHFFDTPKTSGSRRSVGLTVKATEALVRHRDRMRDDNPFLLLCRGTISKTFPTHMGKIDPPAPLTIPINGTSWAYELCPLIEVSGDSVWVPHGE
jgi:integrase